MRIQSQETFVRAEKVFNHSTAKLSVGERGPWRLIDHEGIGFDGESWGDLVEFSTEIAIKFTKFCYNFDWESQLLMFSIANVCIDPINPRFTNITQSTLLSVETD